MNRDNDNFTPKFIMDAMCGIYIHDDDSRHVRRTIIELGYSVENPRTEIWVVPVQPVELIERPVVRKDARPSLVGKRLGRGFGRMVR